MEVEEAVACFSLMGNQNFFSFDPLTKMGRKKNTRAGSSSASLRPTVSGAEQKKRKADKKEKLDASRAVVVFDGTGGGSASSASASSRITPRAPSKPLARLAGVAGFVEEEHPHAAGPVRPSEISVATTALKIESAVATAVLKTKLEAAAELRC